MNRREFLKKTLEGIIVGVPLISGCGKNPVKFELEIIDSDARIVPGKSIDGINLGDTKATVKEKLGTADVVGNWDGIYGGGKFYEYNKVPYAGLTVLFIDTVDSLWVRVPYIGTTKDGIGIGSSLVLLHEVYGTPHKIFPHIKDEVYYYKNNREFRITYKDNYIKHIAIGFVHEK